MDVHLRLFRPRPVVLLAALTLAACIDVHLDNPESPSPAAIPRLVPVMIEYRQPNGCVNLTSRCDEPVIFFGSWMRPGGEFALRPDPSSHLWTGTATGVPVNFPPRDAPYTVRIFDPYVRESPTQGFTAERLKVGGQIVTRFDRSGEAGLIFIDDNGQGRSPF